MADLDSEAPGTVPATVESDHRHLEPYRWRPGVSGNPSGRSKTERAFLAAKYGVNGRKLFQRLDDLLRDPATPKRLQVEICEFLLERMFGKPVVQVDHNVAIDEMANAILADRARHLPVVHRLRAAAQDITPTVPEPPAVDADASTERE